MQTDAYGSNFLCDPAHTAAQEEAAREADEAARKAIREQKKPERKEDFQTRVDALKAKFHKD
jgi:hypothetical protein